MASRFDKYVAPQAAQPASRFDKYVAPAAQPSTPELPWSDVPGQALYNAPASAGKFVGDIWTAVTNPIDTVGALGDLGAGTLREGARAVLPTSVFNAIDSVGNQEAANRASDTASAVGQFYSDRYGSIEGLKNAIATDPVGVLSDASLPLTGAGGLAAKAPGAVGRAGRAAATVGNAIDPAVGLVKAGQGVARGVGNVAEAANAWRSTPHNLALTQVGELGDEAFKPYNAMSMNRAMAQLGPEAVRADVLGEKGYGVARQAANISPEARQTIQNFGHNRQGQQNVRLARDVQRAAGLPPGSREPIEAMRATADRASRPAIDQAYNRARTMGAEIPFSAFDDIMSHPAAADVFNRARQNVVYRERLGEQGGNLAVLDEAKRLLQAHAANFTDSNRGIYGRLAEDLRARTDQLLMGPEYADARRLRQNAYAADEAFTTGEELGQRSPPIDATARGAAVAPQHAPNMAAAYAQTKAEHLLNNNDTAGALTEFNTDMGREAYNAALGLTGGQRVGQAVAREGTYRRLLNALGNSTTARQLIEAGTLGQGVGVGSFVAGFDPLTALTLGGISYAGRRLLGNRLDNMVDGRRVAAAPIVARNLVSREALPSFEALPPTRVGQFADRVNSYDPTVAAKALWAARQGGIANDLASQFGGPR
jgi:hypothetical protein